MHGETNYLADHLSRNPRGGPEAEEFDNYTPITICNKSYRLISAEINTKDYYMKQVAQGASQDSNYQFITQAIKDRRETKEINNDSEDRKMEGEWELLGILETEGGKLITRNNCEVLIP